MTNEQDSAQNERDAYVVRQGKRDAWLQQVANYTNTFRRTAFADELQRQAVDLDKPTLEQRSIEASVCGRVMLRRVMGKASFVTLEDMSGRIQCYISKNGVGDEAYLQFKELWDIGDIVGVSGTLMRTNKGELSVDAHNIQLLNKTLRPLPEKYHGLTDTETKYRKRYLDLIMNPDTKRVFETRVKIIQAFREFFNARGYMEVETPMMHPIPGGATARPFETYHNTLDMPLYLRIAPELYLKRLVVGGFERVFEINRSFRNEGLSTRHNPEFTMLEFYEAYADYQDLLVLTEDLLQQVVTTVSDSPVVQYQGETVDFGQSFRRLTMADALVEYTELTDSTVTDPTALVAALGGENAVEDSWGVGKLQMELFEARVEEKLRQPTFITHYPAEVSPLARRNDDDPQVTDRFELFICGREYANGFSELNDPVDQAARFKAQVQAKDAGDDEAMHFDADYVEALEYGLPPTAGEGIGIDRLVMMLTNSPSIRDVLLFPQMRPRDDG